MRLARKRKYLKRNAPRGASSGEMPKLRIKWKDDAGLFDALWSEADRTCIGHLKGSKLVLDVGCGEGDLVVPGAVVVGVDANVANLLNCIYDSRIVADAHHLPFRKNAFTGVHCRSIVHHVEAERLFDEITLVCKPHSPINIIEPLQGLIMRPLRSLVTTNIHEKSEKPLTHSTILKIREYIRVEREITPFGEFGYLTLFILPKLPRRMRPSASHLARKIIKMQKRHPIPPGFIIMLGRTR